MTLSTLGVVGDGALAEEIRDAAESDGATVVRDSASDVLDADPEAVVAVGESALLRAVRAGVSVPVLPVGAGPGYGGVPDDEESVVTTTVESLVAGAYETESRTLLSVSVGDEQVGQALSDVMLVTTEPARISEYAIRSRDEEVAQFRADGVVVSTPTGSHGYGRSAGGPLLEPEAGVVGVVPVAPFAVNVDHWVLSADQPVTVTVERDEGEVSLLVDDRIVRPVPLHTPVEVVEDGSLRIARVDESRSFFER